MTARILLLALLLAGHATRAQVPYSQSANFRASVGAPVLAADGSSVYAMIRVPGATQAQVMRLSVDGQVLENSLQSLPQTISPDGRWSVGPARLDGLWATEMETGRMRVLAAASQSNHFLGHRANKNVAWSPDSTAIAYVAAEPVSVEDDTPYGIKVYDRILYKTRTSFTDGRRTQIFIATIEGGEPRQLTTGEYDAHSIAWHPDGSRIAFVSNRSTDPDANHNNDIWTVEVSSGEISQLTDTPGTELSPAWSPDGKHLAYLAGKRPINTKDSQAENASIYLQPAGGGEELLLTADLDRRIRSYAWSPDSRSIFLIADDRGSRHLYRVDVDGQGLRRLTDGARRISSFVLSAGTERIIYRSSDLEDPGELWACAFDGSRDRPITHFQADFKKNVAMSVPDTVWFESFDGTKVQAWLSKPQDFAAGPKYPLILTIHGGPHGAYGYAISAATQAYAEAGFGVLSINPRGSTGYGQAFVDGTINNWGGGDYQDLMRGVDSVIATFAWIDADRLGVIGGSYGGYMTNWVITQTDRFKAAVSVASVSNLISFYGTSIYQLLIETEFPGNPWDNYDLLWHWSPLKHVKNVSTPTLFIHGENDHDVPITQAEEMFIALKKLGVESVLVRYPGEGHGFRQAAHRQDYAERRLAWFKDHLHPERVVR